MHFDSHAQRSPLHAECLVGSRFLTANCEFALVVEHSVMASRQKSTRKQEDRLWNAEHEEETRPRSRRALNQVSLGTLSGVSLPVNREKKRCDQHSSI